MAATATTLVLLFAGSVAWQRSRIQPDFSKSVASEPVPALSPSQVVTERIPARPLRLIERSNRSSSIDRVSEDDIPNSKWVVRIADEDFFASLPADQPIALIQNQDGTARLYLLP